MTNTLFFMLLILASHQIYGQDNPLPTKEQLIDIQKQAILQATIEQRVIDKAARDAATKPKKIIVYDTIKDGDTYNDIKGKYNNSIEFKSGYYYIYFRAKKQIDGKIDDDYPYLYIAAAKKNVTQSFYKRGFGLSLLTIPFKVRVGTKTYPINVTSELSNIHLAIGYYWTWDRYYFNGSKYSHKFGFTYMAGPSVEELTTSNSKVLYDTKRAYLSNGIGFTYTFNDKISFSLVPVGFDFAFSDASKKWNYDGCYWYGFGIGIDTSVFSFLNPK